MNAVNIYRNSWTRLRTEIQKKNSWGKNEIDKLMSTIYEEESEKEYARSQEELNKK